MARMVTTRVRSPLTHISIHAMSHLLVDTYYSLVSLPVVILFIRRRRILIDHIVARTSISIGGKIGDTVCYIPATNEWKKILTLFCDRVASSMVVIQARDSHDGYPHVYCAMHGEAPKGWLSPAASSNWLLEWSPRARDSYDERTSTPGRNLPPMVYDASLTGELARWQFEPARHHWHLPATTYGAVLLFDRWQRKLWLIGGHDGNYLRGAGTTPDNDIKESAHHTWQGDVWSLDLLSPPLPSPSSLSLPPSVPDAAAATIVVNGWQREHGAQLPPTAAYHSLSSFIWPLP